MRTDSPIATPRRAIALAAALIALAAAGCTRAENAQAPTVEPIEPPGPVLASIDGTVHEAAAWIDAMPGVDAKRTLIVTALLETSCANDTAELAGRGGFGVTGRTYLVEVEIERQEICLTALGRHELRFETELEPSQSYDDAAIRLGGDIAVIALEIAQ